MKKLSILFTILLSIVISAQKINWLTMKEALEAQKKQPRKIFLHVYTSSCGVCKQMEKDTFSNKETANYLNQNYYPVKFNAESKEELNYRGRVFKNNASSKNHLHDFFQYLGLNGFPSTVFFDGQGKVLTAMTGYMSAAELEPYLQFFSTDEYKKIKSAEEWEKIQKKFKLKK